MEINSKIHIFFYFLMEKNSNDLLIKNKLLKLNFEKNSNNLSFVISKTLFYFFFIKIGIFIYLFICLLFEFKKQKNYIKIIISLFKKNISKNGKSIISANSNIETNIYLDKFETDIYNKVKNKIIGFPCRGMWNNQREFINGAIRRFRPKKIVEIGVREGCGSSIILNAIQDLKSSHLYSIDLDKRNFIGKCAQSLFPNLLSKWTLYKGNIAAKFIEEIGKDIDMVLIDSAHFEPGEILDFLIVLPFLSEEAIIIMHDIANQITAPRKYRGWLGKRNEWAPYTIFNSIRGKIYLPSGKNLLSHDIGARKLDINQKQYYHDYFRILGGQWQYFPKENYIKEMSRYFEKYYDNDCMNIFKEAINFNRKFVKENPMTNLYNEN